MPTLISGFGREISFVFEQAKSKKQRLALSNILKKESLFIYYAPYLLRFLFLQKTDKITVFF